MLNKGFKVWFLRPCLREAI